MLVLAPHPDDEVLAAGGAIQEHLRKKHAVKVVLVTLGDGQRRGVLLPRRHFLRLGERRYRESLAALELLGLRRDRIIALGYPDRGLAQLWRSDGSVCPSRFTKACAVPYEFARTPRAPYTKAALLSELQEIFSHERPDLIYLPHPRDRHPDHHALSLFAEAALHESALRPQRRYYLIHYAGWPRPAGHHPHRALTPPPSLSTQSWLSLELRPDQRARKCEAIACYRSQLKYFEENLFRFARPNEIFACAATLGVVL
ncbi:MAG: PIG-L family deacetylase [Candidatus Bipolaricaulota bacterium]|nr:PIG-L family deacetylase [Candidatus Bipolaricaulota bacterium]MCS7274496.1 PIG-L family deacetylase [Candidatus Bipolaricaulota bacterium]MDW8111107.1 PIG-L family deacetylase [Candidatus Bipolaricaulota bacterium]MDW8329063.1 PIG-L family deacetylase [Candidatus Bipolaricaulota bacterium]